MVVPRIQSDSINKRYEMEEVSQSEKKRLQSLREKKAAFKAKEQAVQHALKDLDNKSRKNKIIFDDDIDGVEFSKEVKKERRNLFDNDENEDEDGSALENIDFGIKKDISRKIVSAGGKLTLGNDIRFKIDERFMEDDNNVENENDVTENNEVPDLQKEKEWQLDILGSVLGVPIVPKSRDTKSIKKGMIRYDPMDYDHKEYEIAAKKSESPPEKLKKKKKMKEEVIKTPSVEVSKDIYFSVSDSLTKSLKEEGEFSLLKRYGKEESGEKGEQEAFALDSVDSNGNNAESKKTQKFQFNFDTKNPFKYDSSDNENEGEGLLDEKTMTDNKIQDGRCLNNLFKNTDHFFFDADDPRFNEAKKFFSKESIPYDEFKSLRQELKQIVRVKIRKNVNKNQPWSYKKKIKKSS